MVCFFFKAFYGCLGSSWWIRYRKPTRWILQGHQLGLSPLLFWDGYSIGWQTQHVGKRLVSRLRGLIFVGIRGSEASPQSVAGGHLLNGTTHPRACHLMLCFLL